jgi:hypothetical protein
MSSTSLLLISDCCPFREIYTNGLPKPSQQSALGDLSHNSDNILVLARDVSRNAFCGVDWGVGNNTGLHGNTSCVCGL